MSGFGGGGGSGFGGGSGGGSGFGGGGGGGGRGRSGGRGRGRGRGRRGGGGGGGGGNNYQGNNAAGGNTNHPTPKLRPCKAWTTTGNCQHNNNCNFAHVVKMHAMIEASSVMPNDNKNSSNYNNNNRYNSGPNYASVTSVAIWETQGAIKIFTGSQDGFWRLWNTQGGHFNKEFEHNMGGPVHCLVVASNFLFCGFESVSPSLPEITVGMIHAWDLNNPAAPPLEFHMQPNGIPYAHASAVTKLIVVDGQNIISGSRDGAIRFWTFDAAAAGPNAQAPPAGFVLAKTLHGHAREITGLAVADSVLWSSSTDGSIRIWDMASGQCQFTIIMAGATPNPQQQASISATGHSNAVTGLVSFKSPSGTFVLSSSLDGDIKAWNGSTGQCVASQQHGEGVVTMSMADDPAGNQILLIGLESGNMMVRNLLQTGKMPAFTLLFTLSNHYTVAHDGAVMALAKGPSGTFYTGGSDGKVLVFQFNGDLGL